MTEPTITWGTDPEFVLQRVSGKVIGGFVGPLGNDITLPEGVPASLVFEGTKGAPVPLRKEDFLAKGRNGELEEVLEHVRVLVDGPMLEVNLAHPQESLGTVGYYINKFRRVMRYYKPLLDRELEISTTSAAAYPLELLDDPGFSQIGCDPDLLAVENIPRPSLTIDDFPRTATHIVRYAGGHVHIGSDPWPEMLPKFIFVRMLATLWTRNIEWFEDMSVWSPYRIPGVWRDKPYGVEYRSPSPSWSSRGTNTLQQVNMRVSDILRVSFDQDKTVKLAAWHATWAQLWETKEYLRHSWHRAGDDLVRVLELELNDGWRAELDIVDAQQEAPDGAIRRVFAPRVGDDVRLRELLVVAEGDNARDEQFIQNIVVGQR